MMDLDRYLQFYREKENSHDDIVSLMICIFCLIVHIFRFKNSDSLKEKAYCVFWILWSIFQSFVYFYDILHWKWKKNADNFEPLPLGELILFASLFDEKFISIKVFFFTFTDFSTILHIGIEERNLLDY